LQRLRFINSRDTEILFDMQTPYIFWKIDGLSLPSVTPIQTQAAGQDGYTLQELRLESRSISVVGHVVGKDNSVRGLYELRKKINSVCNPLYGLGRLVYENDFGAWQISAFCSGIPYADKVRHVQTFNIDFECPSPYWLAASNSVVSQLR